jgi:hypothetical protein
MERTANAQRVGHEDALEKYAWGLWQHGIVATIRDDFRGILDTISDDDIDWDAWRPLYEHGHSPKAAVNRAFARD